MKKVAIVTINDTNNFGNRLQNYALQEFIKKYGFDVETICFKNKLMEKVKIKIKRIIKFFLPNWHTKMVKEIRFKKFTKHYIKTIAKSDKELNNIRDEYSYFIVGSDQVWNYTYMPNLDKYFLPYANYEQAISYAASFGVSDVEEGYKEKIKKGINNIKYLSVREEKGKEIIKELTNRDAEVLVDPTLLMQKEEWIKIERKPKKMTDKPYILVYFLGENIHKEEIKKLANLHGLEIIDITDINQKKYYTLNPNEFIYLFNNAKLIYTDSFHACVFSIIFNKPFFVFNRKQDGVKSMNSRLDTLLMTFNQRFRKIEKINQDIDVFECDYNGTNEILEKEIAKTNSFFSNIFKE